MPVGFRWNLKVLHLSIETVEIVDIHLKKRETRPRLPEKRFSILILVNISFKPVSRGAKALL